MDLNLLWKKRKDSWQPRQGKPRAAPERRLSISSNGKKKKKKKKEHVKDFSWRRRKDLEVPPKEKKRKIAEKNILLVMSHGGTKSRKKKKRLLHNRGKKKREGVSPYRRRPPPGGKVLSANLSYAGYQGRGLDSGGWQPRGKGLRRGSPPNSKGKAYRCDWAIFLPERNPPTSQDDHTP